MLLLIRSDARAIPLRDESVQCVVTSPPYWGLRDYGTARWEGGDPACDHLDTSKALGNVRRNLAQAANAADGGSRNPENRKDRDGTHYPMFAETCGKCGAHRVDQQLGLEPTPDAYVQNMVAVFREVWRVLKPDGVCWLNLGDSYAANRTYQVTDNKHVDVGNTRGMSVPAGLKPKDLVGIPWRVAFALQADGWWLRSDVIWAKKNCMPESVQDRPTRSHEYLFLLTKAASYYYDADAIKENGTIAAGTLAAKGSAERFAEPGVNSRPPEYKVYDGFRNRRSVWHIATQPYPGAHFATMPEALAEPCILAGSRPGDIVFDPFLGSGTTARVALRYGRRAIGCDLSVDYHALADDRTRVTYGLPLTFDEVPA